MTRNGLETNKLFGFSDFQVLTYRGGVKVAQSIEVAIEIGVEKIDTSLLRLDLLRWYHGWSQAYD